MRRHQGDGRRVFAERRGTVSAWDMAVTESSRDGKATCGIWDYRDGPASVQHIGPDEARLVISGLTEYLRALESGELPTPLKPT